ncbi:hypothetical protein QQF64_028023 [Cirrhinus molitorella]|uniref:G-protein coupled receptors family 1 profile domain-containing protein n=1 Tax=Cirrhinus molitorella TaxID=172907 RepID=A0ABR3NE45_9TELE
MTRRSLRELLSPSSYHSGVSRLDLKMNGTEFCPIKPQHISISVLICLTFLVGLLLNVFSLWVFTCKTPEWTSSTVFQVHLAVSDVIICPMGPFIAVYYNTANWLFGRALCQLKIALMFFHIYSSILFLTLISVHRYVLVVRYSQESYMNQKGFVQKLCFGVWLLVLVSGTVLAGISDISTVDNHTLCLSIHQEKYTNFYFIANFSVLIPGWLLAFIISAICYSLLVRSMSRLDTSHDSGQAIKKKSRKMVAVCLAIFIVCFAPMNVVRSVGLVVKKYFSHKCSLLLKLETAYYASWILAGANCCLDPIIYCFSCQKFTKTFHISLRRIGLRLDIGQDESSGVLQYLWLSSKMNTSDAVNVSNGDACVPKPQHMSLAVILCLVYLLGLLLNGFSLWVFTCRIHKWNSGAVLQFNLALSDAIIAPLTPLMAAYFAMESNWVFGDFACQLKIAVLSMHFNGSVIFLTLISVHRYMSVVHFNRSSLIKRKVFVKKLCAAIWCFLIITGIFYGWLLPVTTEDNHNQCLTIYQTKLTEAYFVINFVIFFFWFILPMAISVFCYSRLASSVSRINISSVQGQSVKAKSMRMIGICLFIFGLCFLPLNVVRTVGVVVKKYHPSRCTLLLRLQTAYYACYILAGINCCLDPLIYFFGSRNFIRAFRRSLRVIGVRRNAENKSDSETVSQSANRNAVFTVS